MMRRIPLTCMVYALLATVTASAQTDNTPPAQVSVSVKIIEFQTNKSVQTGLSTYFAQRADVSRYGQVSFSGAVTSADLTFPTPTLGGLTVFLDMIRWSEGDIEAVLQALVDENRAFILSRPKAMVMVAAGKPTIIKTVQKTPYENTVVVGYNAVQVTAFRDTGVTLNITVPQIIDDDGDWSTNDDSYVQMDVVSEVLEEGQRITVALDQQGAGVGPQGAAIQVPEFVSRSINTHVWVRNGQVLILGGLFRNTKDKSLSTVPWLLQGEELGIGLLENVVPGNVLRSPVSSTIGSRATAEGRRELVFLIKAEIWRPAFTVADQHGFTEKGEKEKEKESPTDVITDIVQGISDIPQGLTKPKTGEDSVGSSLGGR